MNIELTVPEDWDAGLTMVTRAVLQQAVRRGFPVITCVRADATPEQVMAVYARVEEVIREAGLAS